MRESLSGEMSVNVIITWRPLTSSVPQTNDGTANTNTTISLRERLTKLTSPALDDTTRGRYRGHLLSFVTSKSLSKPGNWKKELEKIGY